MCAARAEENAVERAAENSAEVHVAVEGEARLECVEGRRRALMVKVWCGDEASGEEEEEEEEDNAAVEIDIASARGCARRAPAVVAGFTRPDANGDDADIASNSAS